MSNGGGGGFSDFSSSVSDFGDTLGEIREGLDAATDLAKQVRASAGAGGFADTALMGAAAAGTAIMAANPIGAIAFIAGQFLNIIFNSPDESIAYLKSPMPEPFSLGMWNEILQSENQRPKMSPCCMPFEEWVTELAAADGIEDVLTYQEIWWLHNRFFGSPAGVSIGKMNERVGSLFQNKTIAEVRDLYRMVAGEWIGNVLPTLDNQGLHELIPYAEEVWRGRYIDGNWRWGDWRVNGVPIQEVPRWIPLSDASDALARFWMFRAWQLGADEARIERITTYDPMTGVAPPGVPFDGLPIGRKREVLANAIAIAIAKSGGIPEVLEVAKRVVDDEEERLGLCQAGREGCKPALGDDGRYSGLTEDGRPTTITAHDIERAWERLIAFGPDRAKTLQAQYLEEAQSRQDLAKAQGGMSQWASKLVHTSGGRMLLWGLTGVSLVAAWRSFRGTRGRRGRK